MKVPLSLLLSFCDPGLSAEEIASTLALTGTEVERIRRLGPASSEGFVVGRVLSADPHPDADRLRVCQVDVGEADPVGIVCGAPNVAAGQTVAVALPGAVMPGGMKIKQAKLRGVESNGMICSEDELELGPGGDGILVLPDGVAATGTPLSEVVPLCETVLDLEITPNRPDCLGVYGVARELHAATGAALAGPPWLGDRGSDGQLDGVSVSVEVPELCPRFTARVYEGIGAAETPVDIRSHLHAAGMRPISPVVDITNYVMLVVGEPLHAFDLDRVAGAELTVRAASEAERVDTLDGQSRELKAGDPVICDAEGPTSIAGVMGGARSEVSEETTRVLLEAAVWNGPAINELSTRLALRSEASGRFEKGLANVQVERGQAFASVLFERIFGVRPNPGTVDIVRQSDTPAAISLRSATVGSLLGYAVDPAGIEVALERLGFTVESATDGFNVLRPDDRLDIEREVDVIEEIARIDGLDGIPATLPAAGIGGALNQRQRLRRRLVDALAAQGMFEIAGWSFATPRSADRLRFDPADPRRHAVVIRNPMSEEESQLRTTLLGTVLDSAARNVARGNRNPRLFEVGPVYVPADGGLTVEPLRACGVFAGTVRPASWADADPPAVDVHAGIAAVCAALAKLGLAAEARAGDEPEPFLHPGRSADLVVGGRVAGSIGELHPLVAAEWDLAAAVVFDLDADLLIELAGAIVSYSAVSDQPAVLQDVAVVVPQETAAAELIRIAREIGGPELESVSVFDVYSGEQVGVGQVSIGLRLAFRAADRTLTEDEASAIRGRIVEAIVASTGGEARG